MAGKQLSFTLKLIDKFTRPIKKVQAYVNRFTHHTTAGVDRMRDAFIGGAAAVMGFMKTVLPAAQFQDRLNMMKTGGQENIRVVEQMEQSALRMNKNFAGGLNESLDLLSQTRRMSGLAGKELELMAGNTLVLNKRFSDMDHQDLLRAQVQVMRDFKVSASAAGDMVGYLASQGGDLKSELLDTIHEYSPQMKALGFNIQQMTATTKAALAGGWSVDKGLDAIKEAGLKLRELDKDSKGALGDLGLGHIGDQLQMGQITTVQALSKIGPAIAGIENDTKKFNLFKNIFGTPSEDVGLSGMLDIMKGMNGPAAFGGTMDELKKGVNKGFLGMLNKVKTGLENMSYVIMSQVLPVLNPLTDMISNGTEQVQGWADKFPYLTKTIGITVLGVFGLILAVSSFSLILGIAHFAIAGVRGIMILWRITIIGLRIALFMLKVGGVLAFVASLLLMGTVIIAIKLAMLAWQGVIWMVNAAIWANPITWIVIAIVALVAVVVLAVVYWRQLRDAIIGVADWFNQMPGWFKILAAVFMPFIAIPLLIISNWESIKTWFSDFWEWLSTGFSSAIDSILKQFQPVLGFFNKIGAAIGLDINLGKTTEVQNQPQTVLPDQNITKAAATAKLPVPEVVMDQPSWFKRFTTLGIAGVPQKVQSTIQPLPEDEREQRPSLANAHQEKSKGAVVAGASSMIKKFNQSTSTDNSKNMRDVHIHTEKEIKSPSTLRSLFFMQGIG